LRAKPSPAAVGDPSGAKAALAGGPKIRSSRGGVRSATSSIRTASRRAPPHARPSPCSMPASSRRVRTRWRSCAEAAATTRAGISSQPISISKGLRMDVEARSRAARGPQDEEAGSREPAHPAPVYRESPAAAGRGNPARPLVSSQPFAHWQARRRIRPMRAARSWTPIPPRASRRLKRWEQRKAHS